MKIKIRVILMLCMFCGICTMYSMSANACVENQIINDKTEVEERNVRGVCIEIPLDMKEKVSGDVI